MEFCFMLNMALFSDSTEASEQAVVFTCALNQLCITRGVREAVSQSLIPDDGVLWRGGSLPNEHREFFQCGVRFRMPAFLSSSADQEVTERFILEAFEAKQPCVQWKIMLDTRGKTNVKFRCKHVNLVVNTHFHDEKEFLFAPYSVFEVVETKWSANPNYMEPHQITLRYVYVVEPE
jgi:hypothetical protein